MIARLLLHALLRAYPQQFRSEYGAELRYAYLRLHALVEREGRMARARLWLRLLADVMRSAPVERWRAWRSGAAGEADAVPDYAGAACAGLAVFVLYWLTLAPTAALWDAGEYITAAHILGIPHPPGNALFVLIGRVWDVLLSPTAWPTAVRINVLSAVASAAAHAFLYLCMERMLALGTERGWRRVAAACAVLLSATAFTVWNQSNVNEKVYTISFLTVLATVWLALRWRDTRNVRLLLLAAYVTALSMTNHLMGALVVPAVLLFVWRVDGRVLRTARVWAFALPALLLALSAQLYLPLRAAQQPLVNESDPSCESLLAATASIYTNGAGGCDAFSATLRREQYAKPSVLRDPTQPERPRGAALIGAQFINYAQYLDWQWARSVAGTSPLFGGARPLITLVVLLLAALGARAHWRADRDGALLHGVLLLTLTAGLVLYLNFRYGYSIARARFPLDEMHEVRERDYFFLISFSLWGAWLGVGIAALWRSAAARLSAGTARARAAAPRRRAAAPLHALARWPRLLAAPLHALTRRPRLVAAPLLALALVPLVLNWKWASRADDWTARDWAYNVLMSVEPYGVLVTNGDNDSFPLWYLQHVERVREDVTVVLSPYIGTDWYARQIRALSRPCDPGVDAQHDRTRILCQRAFRARDVHPDLLAAWGDAAQRAAPKDSILPLTDAEIADMAGDFFIAAQPLELSVGELTGTIAAGTMITPVDTFVAAILQHSYGDRPIHFMAPSPIVDRLGLGAHTVRVGLTWKLREPHDDAVALAVDAAATGLGSAIDLVTTDTLARAVFLVRGRINDPRLPWTDPPSLSIPVQYAVMHYAAALAHEARGDDRGLGLHTDRLLFWNRVLSN